MTQRLAEILTADVPYLLADWEALFKLVVPLVVMLFIWLAQTLGNREEAARKFPRDDRTRLPKPPLPPPAQGPAGGMVGQPNPPSSLEETLRREVEQFLQRARTQQPSPPSAESQRSAPPSLRPSMGAETPQARPRERPTAPSETYPSPRPARDPAPNVRAPYATAPDRRSESGTRSMPTSGPSEARHTLAGDGIARHVKEHIGGAEAIAHHAQHLGETVAHADERMDQHLKDRFEHRIGTLNAQQASVPVGPSMHAALEDAQPIISPSAELRALLSSPTGMRQAIVLGEILRRPRI